MKTAKRIVAVILFLLAGIAVSYLIFTGSRLSSVGMDAAMQIREVMSWKSG